MLSPPKERFDEGNNNRPKIYCIDHDCNWSGDEDDLKEEESKVGVITYHCPRCNEEIKL